MVANMDESHLSTIEQIEQFLNASAAVTFTAHCGNVERCAHISCDSLCTQTHTLISNTWWSWTKRMRKSADRPSFTSLNGDSLSMATCASNAFPKYDLRTCTRYSRVRAIRLCGGALQRPARCASPLACSWPQSRTGGLNLHRPC